MHERMATAKAVFRDSVETDREAILAVERGAFGGGAELTPAAGLPAAPEGTISMVAEGGGQIVGHVLLTPIEGLDLALALAPLAVEPEWRDMQIGTELMRHALRKARDGGWKSVFVLGYPDFYRRFGFKSQLADGAATDVQGPRFLALELEKGALAEWSGSLHYPEAFSAVA